MARGRMVYGVNPTRQSGFVRFVTLGASARAAPPEAAGRLPLTYVRWPRDHALPHPRDSHCGRLVVVPDPLPGHLLDVPVLRRPAGAVGELEPGVPPRGADRGGLLRLDPAAR